MATGTLTDWRPLVNSQSNYLNCKGLLPQNDSMQSPLFTRKRPLPVRGLHLLPANLRGHRGPHREPVRIRRSSVYRKHIWSPFVSGASVFRIHSPPILLCTMPSDTGSRFSNRGNRRPYFMT